MIDPNSLAQTWPRPTAPRPIAIVGSGGIVADAHLPAYRKAGFLVAGVFDIDGARRDALAAQWGIPVFQSMDQLASTPGVVFDVATPPSAHLSVLKALPDAATVLLQKPMGRDLDEATAIRALCREKRLTAAVNFQLRFSPMMLAIRDALAKGLLGRLIDIEVHLNIATPWHLFPFLRDAPRVEIAVHSIHYLDLVRALAGNPVGVMARTLGHPAVELAQTRTSVILDFGSDLRCLFSLNHNHDFGRRFQDATFRFEGNRGAAVAKLGLLLDYPRGEPDELSIVEKGGEWIEVPLAGGWFPDAFIGTMSNAQRVAAGEDLRLDSSVEDAWHTMALVEACYRSNAGPTTPVPAA